MSKLVSRRKKIEFEIHPYDKRIDAIHRLIKRQVSKKIFALVAGVMIAAVAAGLVLFTGLI